MVFLDLLPSESIANSELLQTAGRHGRTWDIVFRAPCGNSGFSSGSGTRTLSGGWRIARGRLDPYESSPVRNGYWSLQYPFCLRPVRSPASCDRAFWTPLFDPFARRSGLRTNYQSRRNSDADGTGLQRPIVGQCAGVHRAESARYELDSGIARATHSCPGEWQLFRYRAVVQAIRRTKSEPATGASAGASHGIPEFRHLNDRSEFAHLWRQAFWPHPFDLCSVGHGSGATRLRDWPER